MDKNEDNNDHRKITKMNIIYKALEDGWSVKKSGINSQTFEFTKSHSLDEHYKGLVIFTKENICNDIQNHLENLKNHESLEKTKKVNSKRSISTPVGTGIGTIKHQ